MSRVSLSGNALGTGTLTIASPNSNTDRTLTLPDQTGTLLTGSGALNINASAPTSSLTLDASGNLGVGTTSPDSGSRLTLDRGTFNQILMRVNGTQQLKIYADSSVSSVESTGPLLFQTSGSERARIDSSGSAKFNTTGGEAASVVISNNVASTFGLSIYDLANSGWIARFFNNSSVLSGSITRSGSSVAYNTSSDYRLKEDIAPMTGALAKVQALKPVTYKWKVDGSDGEGFIAHELQAVCPDAVFGEKDAVNEDGSINPQGIDTSFLVATLTAAIQELKADLDATKAELAELKGQA